MTSWRVILRHPENSPLPRSRSMSSPTDSGWPRKFHGSSICCRQGSLFSYWWVSRSAGLCGFQQAPQRLPDGPSQDGAYCGCVSMGALQMEPPGVIRLLRRGVREGVRGGGVYEQQGVGDGHIFEVDQSLWTVMGWFFSPFFFLLILTKVWLRGGGRLCFICLRTAEWKCKSSESYLLMLQGEETKYLGHSVFPLVWIFGLWSTIISTEQLKFITTIQQVMKIYTYWKLEL